MLDIPRREGTQGAGTWAGMNVTRWRLQRPIQIYEDALLYRVPLRQRLWLRIKFSRPTKHIMRWFRPGWRNRGQRKAEVRDFNRRLAGLLVTADRVSEKEFRLISGLDDLGRGP